MITNQYVINKFNEELGPLIFQYRKEHNLTISEFADKCGISNTLIKKIENGSPNLTLDSISRILDVLDMHISIYPGGYRSIVSIKANSYEEAKNALQNAMEQLEALNGADIPFEFSINVID